MDEQSDVNAVRCMILGVTSSPQEYNLISLCDSKPEMSRKRRMDEGGSTTRYSKAVYCVKGRRMCRSFYSAVVQLNLCTVEKQAQAVSSALRVEAYQNYASKRQQSILSQQSVVSEKSLDRDEELQSLRCPTRRGWHGKGQ